MLNENLKNVNDWTFQYRKKKKKISLDLMKQI